MNNWLPKTQGNMIIRPGTQYKGETHNDTGAAWIEFIASTDDVALIELTHDTGEQNGPGGVARFWTGTDGHNLSLIKRPSVSTVVNVDDTGWVNTSTGGTVSVSNTNDVMPSFNAHKSGRFEVAASTEMFGDSETGSNDRVAWRASQDNTNKEWRDTGKTGGAQLPSWWQCDMDWSGDTGTADSSNFVAVTGYSITCADESGFENNAPGSWRLLASDYDTGTFATDTGKWKREDYIADTGDWSLSEKRIYQLGAADTGTIEAMRFWRFHITKAAGVGGAAAEATRFISVGEFEFFEGSQASAQFYLAGDTRILNAGAIGSIAEGQKKVVVGAADTGKEHSLYVDVNRGPVIIRVGSSVGAENHVSETSLGTGYHNLAFNPGGDFHITLRHEGTANKIISELRIGDTGTLEVTTPWVHTDLDNVRYDQSADVVYVDCQSVAPRKIERRGTGRSWSVVNYEPLGPIQLKASSGAKLTPSGYSGNISITSDKPFFTEDRVGGLIRIFQNGQSGVWNLGAKDAATDVIEVTGIGDTGDAGGATGERRLVIDTSGVYAGTFVIERSFDGPDLGFKQLTSNRVNDTGSQGSDSAVDTGNKHKIVDDQEDNIKVWYRVRMKEYTSGVCDVRITYDGGSTTGVARITGFTSANAVEAEVLERFSDTGSGTKDWEEGYWSDRLGYPTSVALHGGRIYHAQGGSIFGSVSDDFESYSDKEEGDSAPIIRTLGSGPVDNIFYLVSLLRLIIGTSGAEIALRSSSLDEPVTPENSNARTFSTQGSSNLRALKMDTSAIFVQRSGQRVFLIGFGLEGDALGDYKNNEMTFLVPDLLAAGVVSLAIQRQPDTRMHFVLGDGTVAILTYEPEEEVLAWSTFTTDTGTASKVERAMVLPGANEDAVYYQIKRTINGTTKRFLEKWAKETECRGDTGLHWLMDCASSYTDTGRTSTLNAIAPHLAGETVVAWGSLDSGSTPHIDLSPDVEGVQTMLDVDLDTGAADTGTVVLTGYTEGVHHAVVGLGFHADWKSTKLAYGAEAGTALSQMKRTDKMAFVLVDTHNNALLFGNDTGLLDPMPRLDDQEGAIDVDLIYSNYDKHAIPFPGLWDEDSRIFVRAIAPRPANILALVPTIGTNDKA
jgi:hypothetical protein